MSKGLEFPLVAIPDLGYMPHAKMDRGAEARLLYVAMTDGPFTEKFCVRLQSS